jgi:SAM-dependent methyltransferase
MTTAEFWGPKYLDESFHRADWQAHPHAAARQRQLQHNMSREDWFVSTYMPQRAPRGLSIGCGVATTELAMLSKNQVDHFDLIDISPVGLEIARERAKALGIGERISCRTADFASVPLGEAKYDLIVFMSSLHHVAELGSMLCAANAALSPDGLIWAANEYVGPDRFAFPEEHVRYVRGFFRNLPERFRKFPEIMFPTPQDVAEADPSESPCSSQILPLMRRLFPRLEVLDLYGTFAFMLSWGLNPDAIYGEEEGADIVKMILGLDRDLVLSGALPSYFVHLVAHKTTRLQQRAIRAGLHPEGTPYRLLRTMRNALRSSAG